MKVTVLLLVSALSLLVVAAFPSPTQHKATMKRRDAVKAGSPNLKRIIDLAEKYNESLIKEFFVDDVSPLVDAGCGPTFFCKVHDILHQRVTHFEDLVRNLEVYFRPRDVNCTVLLKDVTSTGVSIQLPELMRHLITCSQQTNFKGSNL
ncbi:hypothetical protein Q5P01_019184 [Channa striata]|uniref:Uncharacterized protein n=1 Tax=Channa striata TaxID=64152 RepID=A0AA88M0L5_CHASR|nr:hypothetical protein Q5P01_019184 [Channa striata]